MSKKILIGVLVLSLLGNAYLFSTVQSQSSSVNTAEQLSTSLQTYFRAIDYTCRATQGSIEETQSCLTSLISERTGLDTLEREEFENADEDQSGYIVVKNEGRQSLNASLFTLLQNKEAVDDACNINGTIDQGYTCRLDFNTECEAGGVLEVQYNGTRALLKNC